VFFKFRFKFQLIANKFNLITIKRVPSLRKGGPGHIFGKKQYGQREYIGYLDFLALLGLGLVFSLHL
jgi:hypothetical protein